MVVGVVVLVGVVVIVVVVLVGVVVVVVMVGVVVVVGVLVVRIPNSPQKPMQFFLIVILVHHINIELHVALGVDRVGTKVGFLEPRIHVQSFASKMIRSRDVWYDRFSAFPLLRGPHPHVPVDELRRAGPLRLQLVLIEFAA